MIARVSFYLYLESMNVFCVDLMKLLPNLVIFNGFSGKSGVFVTLENGRMGPHIELVVVP